MNFFARCIVFPLALGALSAAAQGKPAPAASADPFADEPAVIEHYDTVIRMKADGTGETVRHLVVRVHSEGAAQQSSVLALFFDAANSEGTIEQVSVRKPDGTLILTPTADSVELPAPVTREAPVYSDLKQKQLPVRSLAAGDVLTYDLKTVFRVPEVPGQFWGAEHFVTAGVVLSETLKLEIPAAKYVQVWSPRHTADVTNEGTNKVYRWHSEQRKLTSAKLPNGKPDPVKDKDTDDEGRILPSVAWTTFHNWAEVGDWYRALADSRAQPTDALRARADELTRGITTPEQQARALYTFVSEHTRYVGIDLGVGRYQPHPAAETLGTGYGDCKDKDTLLEALLRAKGFATAPALVGVGITTVPDLPSPALFNHVITTVQLPPEKGVAPGRIWLDSTPGIEPYRMLVPQLRGQLALVVPPQQPASLLPVPTELPYAFHESFTVDAKLDATGLLTGRVTLSERSDGEAAFRALQRTAAPAEWDQIAQYLSNSMSFSGTVSHADLHRSPAEMPATVAWDYRRPDYADWSNRRILPLFPSLDVPTIDKENEPEYDIDQGSPRTLEAVTHITLPSEYRAELPAAVHVTRPYATYDQTYSLSAGVLTVTRRTVILQHKVPKAEWKDYLAYTRSIGMEKGENYIQLIAPQNKASSTEKPNAKQPAQESAAGGDAPPDSTRQLIALAEQQFHQNDIAGEKSTLLEVQSRAPDTPYLFSMLGSLAMREHHMDVAIDDLQKELAKHPEDNTSIPLLLATCYFQQKRYPEAVSLLKANEARGDVQISLTLAGAQRLSGDNAAALATLKRAMTTYATDRTVMYAYGNALHAAHRDVEAAAVAKAAMDETDDPGVLNDNSYLLAQTGNDFELAEKNARRSIDLREAETARIAVVEANTAAFFASRNLIAAYDTLAYILLKQGKAAQAETYQQAAWFGQPGITVGDHLALIQEAMGHRDEALATNELALATDSAANNKEDYAETQGSVDRLRKAGAHSNVASASSALQEQRTFKVHRLPDAKGWGTFRVQVGAGGIVDSDLVSGSPAIKPMTAEVNKVKIATGVPPGSKAKLLRDGVLSCSAGQPTCDFVLMPNSGLEVEGVRDETQP